MLDIKTALLYTVAVGFLVFLCRAFPFLFLPSGKKGSGRAGVGGKTVKQKAFDRFLLLVEKTVPLAAMTVLAVNSIAVPVKENPTGGIPVLAASIFTLLVHLWRRNFLISILGGTVLYMVLERLLVW
ncbi:MAG: AzlD domain-containing protein [Treponema sp.]|jgi:branched-subunit amino acid transport protein AzlD|nr:AzlD domain-containing protein [Treponema sp.]